MFVDSAGARRDVPNVVFLITDSNADTDITETIKAAEQLKGKKQQQYFGYCTKNAFPISLMKI